MCNVKGAAEHLRQRNSGADFKEGSRSDRRKLSPRDGMFLTLIRLRAGLTGGALSWLFDVSEATVSRTFESWLLHLQFVFQTAFSPPDKKMREKTCPDEFWAKFKTRSSFIIDCSDLAMQVGSEP